MRKAIVISLYIIMCALATHAADTRTELLQWLRANMNRADSVNYTDSFYLKYAIEPALEAQQTLNWNVPEHLFRSFVLPIRVNNEALDNHRPLIFNELKDSLAGLTMEQAILKVNHWCHSKATYQPSDGRTRSPLATMASALGRCGEESTFAVAALRAVGIPARQVYTPRWAHTDDNHAWVEAWANGRWHFLGACEPEPVLDLGWFNEPAARGMLMLARVFGHNYDGPDDILERQNGATVINVTRGYAPTNTLRVKVIDSNGQAIENAKVSFRIYNYAEFYPVATKHTDANGLTWLEAGLGDVIVWVSKGNDFAMQLVHNNSDAETIITLPTEHPNTTLRITPPRRKAIKIDIPNDVAASHAMLLAREDSLRNAFISSWPDSIAIASLANELNTTPSSISSYIVQARGNYPEIVSFLTTSAKSGNLNNAIHLLSTLTVKDFTDITASTLQQFMRSDIPHTDIATHYILAPRVANEDIIPYVDNFRNHFATRAKKFRQNPQKWVKWVADSIDASLSWYPDQATMHPAKILSSARSTSPLSRDIFFVAGARAFGIPARIDPITLHPQWFDNDGQWHNANFTAPVAKSANNQALLSLTFSNHPHLADANYYTHFTLSKIENGEPQLLNYDESATALTTFTTPQQLEAGDYMLITGQRMADGSVLSNIKYFTLSAGGHHSEPIEILTDSTSVPVIGSFNSESIYTPLGSEETKSILSTTGRGYFVVSVVKANHEPSTHALNDIAAVAQQLEQTNIPIVILFASARDAELIDKNLLKKLPSTAALGIDTSGQIAEQLPHSLPAVIIADTFNRVVFSSEGYTIGLGNQILNRITQLK